MDVTDIYEGKRIAWYRTAIDKGTLKSLTTRSDWLGLKQSLLHLGLVTATGWLTWYAYHNLAWPFVVLGFFAHGTFMSFCSVGAAGHELSHGTPFKSWFLNEFFTWIFAFLSWTNQHWFRTSHRKHHQYTVHRPWDLEVVLPRDAPTFWGWVKAFTIDPVGIYALLKDHIRKALGYVDGEWANQIYPKDKPEARRALANWSRAILLSHVALAILFASIGEWILIPIVVTPFYCGWLNAMCGITQHQGMQSAVPDFRRSCRTVILAPFTSFLYWQMNYHVEHHMFAGVPFYNLRKLHALVQADGGPTPNHGLLDALREIYMIARYQKGHPGTAFDAFSRGAPPSFVPQQASTEHAPGGV